MTFRAFFHSTEGHIALFYSSSDIFVSRVLDPKFWEKSATTSLITAFHTPEEEWFWISFIGREIIDNIWKYCRVTHYFVSTHTQDCFLVTIATRNSMKLNKTCVTKSNCSSCSLELNIGTYHRAMKFVSLIFGSFLGSKNRPHVLFTELKFLPLKCHSCWGQFSRISWLILYPRNVKTVGCPIMFVIAISLLF